MNSKSTWTWLIIAAGLFAFIFLFERYLRPPVAQPGRVLPGLNAARVTSISVVPAGQLEIRADRANTAWQLTKPIVYPAQAALIENLLGALERLTLTNYITADELREQTNADEQFGFDPAQFKLILDQNDRCQVLIGNRTPPGDQVYLQVVGSPGIYIVDARLLNLIPRTTNDWRDRAFVDLRSLTFDHISVITDPKTSVELHRDATNHLWRITSPKNVRADNERIADSLQKLQDLKVAQFVTDDPKADLERFDLQPAKLELKLKSAVDTNQVAVLQFGKSPTNDASLVYARRIGVDSVVAIARDAIAPWLAPPDDYRDHHLVNIDTPIDQIDVSAEDRFILERQPGNTWQLVSTNLPNLPVDSERVGQFLNTLATMQITRFLNAVTAPDKVTYGLSKPVCQILLSSTVTNATGAIPVLRAQLSFGTNQEDKVFVERADENSVYEVKLADFQQLPTAGWQLRERRVWSFSENEVARLAIHQNGKVLKLEHMGTNSWSQTSGPPGITIDKATNDAIEETVHRFGELAAASWIERGEQHLDRYGFNTNRYSLVFELKNGEQRSVEFGDASLSEYAYAATTVDGEKWVFNFPLFLYALAQSYLSIPTEVR